jgi:hypothetical protein
MLGDLKRTPQVIGEFKRRLIQACASAMPDILPPLIFGSDRSHLPPAGHVLLVTDQLASSAEFVLHRVLATALKAAKPAKCILVSTMQNYIHWKAVAARSVGYAHGPYQRIFCSTPNHLVGCLKS